MSGDFANEMGSTLRRYYLENIDRIQESVESIVPDAPCEKKWFDTNLSDEHFVCDQEVSEKALYRPMRQYIKARGKLLRPLLTSVLVESYGRDSSRYKPILAISEIIHCSSLILDDIVDRSLIRRGQPCSHVIHGVSIAGNGSMAATFYAFSLINEPTMPLSANDRLKLYEILFWEHYGCSIGTALDLGWSYLKRTQVDPDQYIQHIVYRSCAYTYRVAGRIGAISGGADADDQETIYNYTTLIGIAFQYIDDILNIEPETSEWGKTIGEDITEGKRSPLVLHSLKVATDSDRQRLLEILDSRSTNQDTINEALAIFKKYDAIHKVRADATRFVEMAVIEVDKLRVPDNYKDILKEFAYYVLSRKI